RLRGVRSRPDVLRAGRPTTSPVVLRARLTRTAAATMPSARASGSPWSLTEGRGAGAAGAQLADCAPAVRAGGMAECPCQGGPDGPAGWAVSSMVSPPLAQVRRATVWGLSKTLDEQFHPCTVTATGA